jgi:hypothetical protein
VICGFVEVTQVALVYGFGYFFLIKLIFFIVYFSHIVTKLILEKNHVIKLYEVIKIKYYGGNHCSHNPIALWITIVIHSVLLSFLFYFFLIFVMIFFQIYFLLILSFKIEIVDNLVS